MSWHGASEGRASNQSYQKLGQEFAELPDVRLEPKSGTRADSSDCRQSQWRTSQALWSSRRSSDGFSRPAGWAVILDRGSQERAPRIPVGLWETVQARPKHFEEIFQQYWLNRRRKMKTHFCLVCGALAGITIQHFTAFADTTKSISTSAAPAPTATPAPLTNERSSRTITNKTITKECENEWTADKETMMKHGMTEDSYVEQCSVKDDVPTIPPIKTPPSSTHR